MTLPGFTAQVSLTKLKNFSHTSKKGNNLGTDIIPLQFQIPEGVDFTRIRHFCHPIFEWRFYEIDRYTGFGTWKLTYVGMHCD